MRTVLRTAMGMIGLMLLTACSGGGGEEAGPVTPAAQSPAQPPVAQPDMLTATPQGLLRGKANGQGQRLIFAKPDMQLSEARVTGSEVLYRRSGDVWMVGTDGVGDRALLSSPDEEDFIMAVIGPWLIYMTYTSGRLAVRYGSLNIETGAQFPFDDSEGTYFKTANASRMISITAPRQISSITVTGTDRITYERLDPRQQQAFNLSLVVTGIVGNVLIYSREANNFFPALYSRSYAIPLAGGTAISLDEEERYNTYSAWNVGERVVYHRCVNTETFPFLPCDVASIQNNGANRVVLTTHPANEAVQGVVGDQVLIRRNLSGNDHLLAVPVTGGPERLLMVMTDEEFVTLVMEDMIIVRRPSGTWSLDLNGKLTKLGTVSGFEAEAVGDSVCVNTNTSPSALWCMPLDGSGPQVKIANEGNVVGVL